MSEYQGILLPEPPVSKQCSEAAWEELLDECDEQFNYMQQVWICGCIYLHATSCVLGWMTLTPLSILSHVPQLQNDIAVIDADSSENQLNEVCCMLLFYGLRAF